MEGRAVAGHGERDLAIGKGGKTAVAALVERTSRFLIVIPLTGRVSDGAEAIMSTVNPLRRRSNGHRRGTAARKWLYTTTSPQPVCPDSSPTHSTWERGGNDDSNRIVHDYVPKGLEIISDPTT
ncbi:hypothetical protein GCM10022222_51200 [Amycolatopsis ultiminotia]|uniref:Transposase n=1 Tax=Amycolatopsis ultiminotia TaxID=543629 RepID=A0ABP6X477_9PSEU